MLGAGLDEADAEIADRLPTFLGHEVERHPLAGPEEAEHALIDCLSVDRPLSVTVVGDEVPDLVSESYLFTVAWGIGRA